MNKVTTLLAVLTLTLMSCKKEKPLQESGIFHATVYVYAGILSNAHQKMYKNGELIDGSNMPTYNFRDTLTVEVKNTLSIPQLVSIDISVNDFIFVGTANDSLKSGETLTLKHIF